MTPILTLEETVRVHMVTDLLYSTDNPYPLTGLEAVNGCECNACGFLKVKRQAQAFGAWLKELRHA